MSNEIRRFSRAEVDRMVQEAVGEDLRRADASIVVPSEDLTLEQVTDVCLQVASPEAVSAVLQQYSTLSGDSFLGTSRPAVYSAAESFERSLFALTAFMKPLYHGIVNVPVDWTPDRIPKDQCHLTYMVFRGYEKDDVFGNGKLVKLSQFLDVSAENASQGHGTPVVTPWRIHVRLARTIDRTTIESKKFLWYSYTKGEERVLDEASLTTQLEYQGKLLSVGDCLETYLSNQKCIDFSFFRNLVPAIRATYQHDANIIAERAASALAAVKEGSSS